MFEVDLGPAEFRHAIQGLNSIYANEPNQIKEIAESKFFEYKIDVSTNSIDASTTTPFRMGAVVPKGEKYSAHTVYEPFSGMVDENGNKHSPVSGLYHELQHGYDIFTMAKEFEKVKNFSKSAQEKVKSWYIARINWASSPTGIHGYISNDELGPTKKEAKYQAAFLGEQPRPNHRGVSYWAKWPFTIESTDGKYPSLPK